MKTTTKEEASFPQAVYEHDVREKRAMSILQRKLSGCVAKN